MIIRHETLKEVGSLGSSLRVSISAHTQDRSLDGGDARVLLAIDSLGTSSSFHLTSEGAVELAAMLRSVAATAQESDAKKVAA